MTGSLNMNNNRIYNVAEPNGDNQPATKIWSENKFLDKSSRVMDRSLNMSNNKITHLAPQQKMGMRWTLNSSINIHPQVLGVIDPFVSKL